MPHEQRVVSAHRTPDLLFEYAATARGPRPRGDHRRRRRRGAPARHDGGEDARCRCSACRCESKALNGMDSLLSIVQMPAGVPVGTLAIGRAGAVNAALLAAAILSPADAGRARGGCERFRRTQTERRAGRPRPARPQPRAGRDRSAAASSAACWRWPGTRSASAAPCSTRRRTPAPAQVGRPDRRRLRRSPRRSTALAGGQSTSSRSSSRTCRPRRPTRLLADAAAGAPAAGGARGGAGPAGREARCSRELGIRPPAFARGRRRRPTSTRVAERRHAGVLKTRRLGYDGKGQAGRARRASRRAPGARRSASVPLILEALRAVRPRAVDRSAVRGRDGDGARATRWSRTTTATASCGSRSRPRRELDAGARRRRPRRYARLLLERLDYVGVLALELFAGRRPAAGQRDRAARAQLGPLDDRGRRDQPVREPPARRAAACRWARRRRGGRAPWST